ncbi:hypothetical protein [Amycolatopsis rubida]|uniref:hypothetical protein n=1 Tax=Amycolatopsis rubida TaxID=112413 RepID=UPI000B0D001D|nr:hypothetical protein [Amycolatopsis rubida]
MRRDLVERGEDAAAEWVVSCTDAELLRPRVHRSLGVAEGAVDAVCVHEGKPRKLARAPRKKPPELSAGELRRRFGGSRACAVKATLRASNGVRAIATTAGTS